MMKFNKIEKLLLFTFGSSDRAETFCRLGAVSVAVECRPFSECCEALRAKLQVHQESESDYREAFYRMRMEMEDYLYACVDVLKDHFREPAEEGSMALSDYDRVYPFLEMGKSILLTICYDEEIAVTLERLESLRENMTDLRLQNAVDEVEEDLYSLNDNEPWFCEEYMARHSLFAKALFRILKESERKPCCGACHKANDPEHSGRCRPGKDSYGNGGGKCTD